MNDDSLPIGTHFHTDLPARLDRLPWSRWHWRVVTALGITWVLDGLEVTLVGSVASVLGERDTLGLSESQLGAATSAYLAGAIAGALIFGRLTDRLGRKRLFLITLTVYLGAAVLTALSFGFVSFALFRALTGAGIGGEYAAINSAIDELLPARVRGRADLAINSTYWLGTALGAGATLVLLDPRILPHALGWRLSFGLGAALGFAIILVRRHVPESPRWLLLHGHVASAEQVVREIEHEVESHLGAPSPHPAPPIEMVVKGSVSLREIARVLLRVHRRRSLLGLVLMAAQAFAYNGVFFTYGLVLARFYGVRPDRIGLFILPFAAGNLLGPIVLGRLFDSLGRRTMIALTYATSGALLLVVSVGFALDRFTATGLTVMWSLVFFVASSAASSAYLTVSELFPVELRGMAIAVFYAIGTAVGGLVAPALFGALVQTGRRETLCVGYLIGAGLLIAAGIVAAIWGVAAENKSLESLAAL